MGLYPQYTGYQSQILLTMQLFDPVLRDWRVAINSPRNLYGNSTNCVSVMSSIDC